jgi:membrane protein
MITITLLFALIFKFLPDVGVQWRDVWLGAFVTAALFNVGKYLIGLYLGQAAIGSAYGAAGSVVIVLLWTYYSAQIMFFGAEFTQACTRRRGSPLKPRPYAVFAPCANRATVSREPA